MRNGARGVAAVCGRESTQEEMEGVAGRGARGDVGAERCAQRRCAGLPGRGSKTRTAGKGGNVRGG